MLNINLLPVREARRKEDVRQLLMQGLLMLIVVGSGVAFAHSRITDQIALSNSRVDQMKRDIDQFKPQLEKVAAFRKQKARLEKKIKVIADLDRARSGPVQVLNELANRTPERLWLTKLSTQNGEIFMEGLSLDNDLVALFLRSLGESPFFKDVDLDNTKLKEGALRLVSFKIRAVLVSPGAPEAAEAPKAA
jgi:type IV pilus assembly protein PilN